VSRFRKSLTTAAHFALCVIFLEGCGDAAVTTYSGPCSPSSGEVSRVIDGDTIELVDGTTVRYLLVDTPELGHNSQNDDCFGAEAKSANESLVLGQTVDLTYDEDLCEDIYNRNLAYVTIEGRSINKILLERGYAKTLFIYPKDHPNAYLHENDYLQVQEQAQEFQMGLWGACE
jgi:micrococcal nuclease